MKKLTLFVTFLDEYTGKAIQQILIEASEMIYNRVVAIQNNENIIAVEVFDENANLIFSKWD